MYAYLKGTLVEATPAAIVLEVRGIGFQLQVPVSDFGKLPAIGGSVLLYTTFVVREMSQTLYGFLRKEARLLFEELITISGIGPKMGLAVLGHLSLEELREAVTRYDPARLACVPGIGKKTAERLMLELQGKWKMQVVESSSQINDALQALMQLGYSQVAAEKAVNQAKGVLSPDCDLSTLISAALKYR